MSSLEEFAKAIEDGNSSIVESLISSGSVDVNARLPRPFQPPALAFAAEFGRVGIVDILLRANARVNVPDERGSTACHVAAKRGRSDVLALLLARQPNLAAVDADERTAFCIALRNFPVVGERCALMLLEAGASVELVSWHLCQFAAASTAAIQALIDRGVVVRELRTFDDGTPLHAAGVVTMRDAAVFDMLVNVCGTGLEVRHRIDGTCLHSAARTMNVFAVRWLLNAGADANSLSSNGSTPLHNVVDRDCAVSLLAAGANVCARDNRGRTALQRVMPIEMAAVHPLIAAGADLDAVDNDGKTARQMLARRGWTSDPDKVEVARRDIAKMRLDFVRYRAIQVCIGLQSLRVNALQMCEILLFACGALAAQLIPFHIWWKIATTVKHFRSK
jgi:ankyrin repeat protein